MCQRWPPTCGAVGRDNEWCWKGTGWCWAAWLGAAGPCSTAGASTTATSPTGRRSTGELSPAAGESLCILHFLPPHPHPSSTGLTGRLSSVRLLVPGFRYSTAPHASGADPESRWRTPPPWCQSPGALEPKRDLFGSPSFLLPSSELSGSREERWRRSQAAWQLMSRLYPADCWWIPPFVALLASWRTAPSWTASSGRKASSPLNADGSSWVQALINGLLCAGACTCGLLGCCLRYLLQVRALHTAVNIDAASASVWWTRNLEEQIWHSLRCHTNFGASLFLFISLAVFWRDTHVLEFGNQNCSNSFFWERSEQPSALTLFVVQICVTVLTFYNKMNCHLL